MINNQTETSVSFSQNELRTILFSISKLVQGGSLSLGDIPIIATIREKLLTNIEEDPQSDPATKPNNIEEAEVIESKGN